ncbi:putative metalloprotease CJM1_0395 family protein [Azospirillum sp. TSO35-2]|uniref:putative metalloprotease CJM1_0395 family protein n=1 Tax=Azospirillum sp. TSO35-2 TaxID=716796 RepID=UPI000D609548|nr:putative metalloprotease CJM1_0395 family protein [Azospirillum sp. TSO35-2]PWC39735.1 hypothetical protein TSO352_06415 [Azospirillum sp. TSO35-2]
MAVDVSISSLSIGTYATPRTTTMRGDGKTAPSGKDAAADGGGSGKASSATTVTLSDAAQQQVQKLKQADTSVRQHEAAHQAAGGSNAGGASFTYTRGPDGKNYATAGEVPIDISPEGEPAATIAKMEQVKAAALAPADPSAQDVRVAAQADAAKLQAQAEQRQQGGGPGAGGSSVRASATAAYGAAQALGRSDGQRGSGLVV